jgi:hypothetical protein
MNVDGPVPPGYDEKRPIGRPIEKASMINTQNDPLGKDRLGRKDNNTRSAPNETGEGTPNGGSPVGLSELNKHKALFEGMNIARKKLIFEPEQESGLLDEKNIKDIQ